MARIKINALRIHRTMQADAINPVLPGVYTTFTDGKGHQTTSRWTSPQDHTSADLTYLSNRHPNIKTNRHVDIFKEHYNEYMPKLNSGEISQTFTHINEADIIKQVVRDIETLPTRLHRSENKHILNNKVSHIAALYLYANSGLIPETLHPVIDLLSQKSTQYDIIDNQVVTIPHYTKAIRLLEELVFIEPAAVSMIRIIEAALDTPE